MQMYATHLSVMKKWAHEEHISPDSIRLMIQRLATSSVGFEIILLLKTGAGETIVGFAVFARLLHTSLHSICRFFRSPPKIQGESRLLSNARKHGTV